MSTRERIEELIEDAAKLEKKIKRLVTESKDYDLSRLLKKVDAEMMDLQHSLDIAFKFLEEEEKD
ncbi:MAG: hypothetical protein A2W07_04535 [candidate division Zixibacteria bacterium RBG_16_43_9]|nr:MAG: hypothetical protein A2W07_04535 [candidate division Zixibacteria bacterium RBG_16_43_9]